MSTNYREITAAVHAIQEAEHALGCATVALREQQAKLGAALRACREAKGITLRDVARKLGVSAPFVSDCELGRRNLSDKHREAYQRLLRPMLNIR
jgi:predicted transcriptional regulator